MTAEDAVKIAEAQRAALDLAAGHPVVGVEKVWIELGAPEVIGPRSVRDVLAWLVTFDAPPGPQLAIEDATGEIIRVDWLS